MGSSTGKETAMKEPKKRKRGTLSVSGAAYRKFKAEAEARGTTVSRMVEAALQPVLYVDQGQPGG